MHIIIISIVHTRYSLVRVLSKFFDIIRAHFVQHRDFLDTYYITEAIIILFQIIWVSLTYQAWDWLKKIGCLPFSKHVRKLNSAWDFPFGKNVFDLKFSRCRVILIWLSDEAL